jgi:hypothetical protein
MNCLHDHNLSLNEFLSEKEQDKLYGFQKDVGSVTNIFLKSRFVCNNLSLSRNNLFYSDMKRLLDRITNSTSQAEAKCISDWKSSNLK